MEDFKICRICMRIGAKVYKYDKFKLKLYYEELTSIQIGSRDGLPQYFCFECAMLLTKFYKFKQKCHIGQVALKDILEHGPITYESVYKYNKKNINLQSPLGIITDNKRVKTYLIKNSELWNSNQNIITTESGSDNEHVTDIDTDQPTEKVKKPDMMLKDKDEEIKLKFDDIKNNVNKSVIEEFIEPCDDDIADQDYDSIEESKEIGPAVVLLCEDPIDLNVTNVDETDNFDVNMMDVASYTIISCESDNTARNIRNKSSKKVLVNKYQKKKENQNDNQEKEYKFTKKRKANLDPTKWMKISLTEEEAVKEFEQRAQNQKYIAATYRCEDCYKCFSREDIMKRHMKLKHSEAVGAFECRLCRARCRLRCQLRKHMRTHYTKYRCLVCNLVVAVEATAVMHEDTHSGVTRRCHHCGEEFKHLSTYYTHLRTHRSAHVCAACGASFVSAAGLHQHRRVKHLGAVAGGDGGVAEEEAGAEGARDTWCAQCGVRFETSAAYREHWRTAAAHADCDDRKPGDKTAAPRRNRRVKRRKPTTCHQCGEHFDTQSLYTSHHLKEHPRTPFFPPNERYICEICGASLSPGSIAMHHNIHTRARLFPCDACGRQFHTHASLKRHLVTHTGEKPYGCPLCDKRFTQSNSMKLHYRTFHLKQPYPKRNRNKKKEEE